jgi:L-threonylcarbamoyladenylate synthase
MKAAFARKLRAQIAAGGLIAYATASCFGLGCDPMQVKAVRKLLRVKARPKQKGLIIIAHAFASLAQLMQPLSVESKRRAVQKWPGPYTWLMPTAQRVPAIVRGRSGKLAVRVDAHPDAVAVCRVLNKAIVSTSLNRAGRVPIRTYREALRQFGSKVLVVRGKIGTAKTPSVVQDFDTGQVLRG